ncbi:hypothetical protein HY969_02445 [Candidatus Kaiserbacteria bacterium]|nr:hypothetical protein [Candidatus Kaiserbacteria bacterium]
MELGTVTNFFSGVPADWIIIACIAAVFLIDALRVGSGRIAAFGISATLAVQVSAALGGAAFLGALSTQFSTPVLQAALFVVILIAVFLLIRRIAMDYGETGGQPIQALFAAVAASALVLLAWVQVPALHSVWDFGGGVKSMFGEAYRFWWLIGSLAALAFSKA